MADKSTSMTHAVTLGDVTVRQLGGLYYLNDLHQAAGGEDKHQPAFFMRREETQALAREVCSADSQIKAFETVRGRGKLQGTYVCRELVVAYAAWISATFHLKVIRVFLAAASPKTQPDVPKALSADVEALEAAARMLRISESGKLGMVRYAFQQKAPHLLGALPVYAVDAPEGAKVAGSSEPTFSATHLLKERNAPITTAKFNALLADKGIIEKRSRPSSSGVNKDFWVVTNQYFGKNLTSPGNPRETQPHWYESRFDELLSTVRV